MTNQPQNNPPIATHRDGALSAKIWRNTSKDGAPFYSVTFQRTYTDPKTNTPRESRSFNGADVLKIQQLAAEAYRTIAHERALDRDFEKANAAPQQGLAQQRDAAFENAPQPAHQRPTGDEPSMG